MRKLAPEEAALWKRVVATVKPLHAVPQPVPELERAGALREPPKQSPSGNTRSAALPRTHPQPLPKREGSKKDKGANTLDASWDRRLSRGLVAPESIVDLHGHSLSTAYDRLDQGLAMAIARGDRVLLLVTGRPPRPESERPHARGAIRAAVGDWLAASRHSARIAAVRAAHPRHGGAGALYIVLRRDRSAAERNS